MPAGATSGGGYHASIARRAAQTWRQAAAALVVVFAGCASDGESADPRSLATSPDSADSATTAASPPATYIVVANDSLSGIAARAATSLDALLAVNDWPEGAAHPIFPGDIVTLPAGAAQPADPGTLAQEGTQVPDEQVASPGPGDGALPDGAIPFSQFDQVTVPPSDRSPGDPIGDPLEDGRYYADRYALSTDGTRVEFTLARFFTTDECLARHSIAPDSHDADGCYGYEIDTSSTAHVSMPVSGGAEVLVQLLGGPGSDSYWYLASSEEFGELLAGTGPPWRDRWIRGGAFVHLAGGDVARVDITLTGS